MFAVALALPVALFLLLGFVAGHRPSPCPVRIWAGDERPDHGFVLPQTDAEWEHDVAEVLAATERQAPAWFHDWNQLAERLPDRLASRLPRLCEQDPGPWDWLQSQAGHPVVARAVRDHWADWPIRCRIAWLWVLGNQKTTRMLPDHLVPIATACRSSDPLEADRAIVAVLAHGPVPEPLHRPLREAITRHGLPLQAYRALRESPALPAEVLEAIAGRARTAPAAEVARAHLLLCRHAPDACPPGRLLPGLLPRLSEAERLWLLGELRLPVFRDLARHPVIVDALATAVRQSPPGSSREFLASVAVLESAGPAAGSAAPDLAARLAGADREGATALARAFASVAPVTDANLGRAALALTNRHAAPAMLLWLTAAGTNAAPFYAMVHPIAIDLYRHTEPTPAASPASAAAYTVSPELLRRYGIRPRRAPTAPPAPRTVIKYWLPSRTRVEAVEACPAVLAGLWPGLGAVRPGGGDAGTGSRLREAPDSTLATLAGRCVVAMTNGTPVLRGGSGVTVPDGRAR